jgi:glycosyltransferase involved in cell wall biosynthesis
VVRVTKIRMTHLVTGLVQGGAEMTLARLLANIDRDRFVSEVIALGEFGPMADRIRSTGVALKILGMRRGRPSVAGFCRLASELRRFRPQVLQTWLYHADIAGLIAGRATGVPAIVWNVRASDMDMSHYRTMSALTLRACARWSHQPTAVIVNSQAGKRHHERLGYRPRRWVLIPNGVDTTVFKPDAQARLAFRTELRLPEDAILIGSVARFDPMKNQPGLLRAAAIVARGHPRAHFLLAGANVDWSNPVLRDAAADPSLQGRVHLLGPRRDVPRLMAALDLAVSSSSYGEGSPNVLAEAMACGVACVATDVGDSCLIVGATGEVVMPDDPLALAAAIGRVVQLDAAARVARGMAARTRMLEEYDLPIAVARYEQLYASLLEQRRSAA